MILLEKSVHVLNEGVLEGGEVFANISKYVRMGAWSNFGNISSVRGASIFVPLLPMVPLRWACASLRSGRDWCCPALARISASVLR